MSRLRYLVVSFAIGACASPPALGTPSECPSQDFSEFIEAFAESTEIQRAFTSYPLEIQQLDLKAEPEPRPFTRSLERHQVEFPVLPGQSERKAKSLELRVNPLASGHAELVLWKRDTDYQVSYFFRKNACWELERIEDGAL
ncbi:hypothetical protein HPC49_01800 [Pyxidicoccus fallax]|uniref:Lipoprotein n=1 Tax=Pyxidicoccus fallax TaxID=394095 RepID=A0A848LAG0_9BACT|nr:hypothetical protein [Pyxidicoccus fallax]NMO15242.1 hypothetical protein [Pyxidicoccus fallax]NPC76986.1 hypothetical protein [Pyxidicoccus fallax]